MSEGVQTYSQALGEHLRRIRMQRGLTLQAVQRESNGRWSALVVGAWERADRAITVIKLAELAEFYGVPATALLPREWRNHAKAPNSELMIDLQRLALLPAHRGGPLARYAATIQAQRDDHSGKALTIRISDLQALAVIYDLAPSDLFARLVQWGVLLSDTRL